MTITTKKKTLLKNESNNLSGISDKSLTRKQNRKNEAYWWNCAHVLQMYDIEIILVQLNHCLMIFENVFSRSKLKHTSKTFKIYGCLIFGSKYALRSFASSVHDFLEPTHTHTHIPYFTLA